MLRCWGPKGGEGQSPAGRVTGKTELKECQENN